MMSRAIAAILLTSAWPVVSHATTFIGTISGSHCTNEMKAIPGDDEACVVFIASDQQVYKVPDQARIRGLLGKEVSVVGTVTPELTIGVSYETQGILNIDSIAETRPLEMSPAETSSYKEWMLSLQTHMASSRKAITAKDVPTAAREAAELVAVLDKVAQFWRARSDAEALQYAEAARDAARGVGSAQTLFDQAVTLQKAQDGCGSCHLAHRSGRQGTFRAVK